MKNNRFIKLILRTLILLSFNTIFSRYSAQAIEPSSCLNEIYGGVINGVPKYWAQRMIRPKDESLYLRPEEIARKVTVAVDDAGPVAFNEPELASLFTPTVDGQSTPTGDRNGHGSAVISLLSSVSPAGILPSKNVGIQYYNETSAASTKMGGNDFGVYALRKILEYNETQKNPADKIKVFNYNPSGRQTFPEDLLDEIDKSGELTIVMSAGNLPTRDDEITIQNRHPSIIAVGALSNQSSTLASYSSYGHATSFVAGSEESPVPLAAAFGSFNGTCGASPQISAALVTLQKVNPNLNSMQLRAILKATANNVSGARKDMFGFGLPNIPLAVTVAREINLKNIDGKSEEQLIQYVKTDQLKKITQDTFDDVKSIQNTLTCGTKFKFPGNQKTCQSYAEDFDKLWNQYFISGADPRYSSLLCAEFMNQKLRWGILNFCPLTKIITKYGKNILLTEPSLVAKVLTEGKDALGADYIHILDQRLHKSVGLDKDIAYRDVLNDHNLMKQNPNQWLTWANELKKYNIELFLYTILKSSEVLKKFPKQWGLWTQDILKNQGMYSSFIKNEVLPLKALDSGSTSK